MDSLMGSHAMMMRMMMTAARQEMLLEPTPVVVRFVAHGAHGTECGTSSDRSADLHERVSSGVTASLQLVAMFRGADREASGGPGDGAGCESRARPRSFMYKFVAQVMMMVARGWTRCSCGRGHGRAPTAQHRRDEPPSLEH